jgi:hypothetical protein
MVQFIYLFLFFNIFFIKKRFNNLLNIDLDLTSIVDNDCFIGRALNLSI